MIRGHHDVPSTDQATRRVVWANLGPGDAGSMLELPDDVVSVTVSASGIMPAGTLAGFDGTDDLQNFGKLLTTAGAPCTVGDGIAHVRLPTFRYIKPGVDHRSPAGASVTFEAHIVLSQQSSPPAPVAADISNVVQLAAQA